MEARKQFRMLVEVARALGPELINQVTFVGGCTTALLLTDEVTAEQVRHTDDVDLIVHVISYAKPCSSGRIARQRIQNCSTGF